MDRLEAHTSHCRSCSTALRRLQRLRSVSGPVVVAALALVAWCGPSPAALGALLLGAAALAWRWQCGRWIQQLRRGSGEPPRNRIS